MSSVTPITPVNRRLVITLNTESDKPKSGVLLPDGYKPDQARYKKALLLCAATDCSDVFRESEGKEVFVENSMIEKVTLCGQDVLMVLENYVLGICR